MAIVFPCPCGQPLQVADAHAGKQVRCPKCSKLLWAPLVYQAVEVAPAPEIPDEDLLLPDSSALVPLQDEKIEVSASSSSLPPSNPSPALKEISANLPVARSSTPANGTSPQAPAAPPSENETAHDAANTGNGLPEINALASKDSWELTAPQMEIGPPALPTEAAPESSRVFSLAPSVEEDDEEVITDLEPIDEEPAGTPPHLPSIAPEIVAPPAATVSFDLDQIHTISETDILPDDGTTLSEAPSAAAELSAPAPTENVQEFTIDIDEPHKAIPVGPPPTVFPQSDQTHLTSTEPPKAIPVHLDAIQDELPRAVPVHPPVAEAPVVASAAAPVVASVSLPGRPLEQIQSGGAVAAPGAIDPDSMPILDEEQPGTPSAEGWYDSRGILTEDRPKKRKVMQLEQVHRELREEAHGLSRVGQGLTLCFWGLLLLMITYIFNFVIGIFLAVMRSVSSGGETDFSADSLSIAAVLLSGSYVLKVAAGVVNIAGMFFCCWAPRKSQARYFSLVALFLLLGGTLPYLVATLWVFVGGLLGDAGAAVGMLIAAVFELVGNGLYIASFACFFIFLRRFSNYIDEDGIARESTDLMIIWLWVTVIGPFLFIVFFLIMLLDFYLFMGLLFIYSIVMAYWDYYFASVWIRWLNLIACLRKVLLVFYDI